MQAKTSTAELRLKIILSILSILITKKQIDSFKNSKKIELYHSKEQLQKFVNDAKQRNF